jgi:hypothetical protein
MTGFRWWDPHTHLGVHTGTWQLPRTISPSAWAQKPSLSHLLCVLACSCYHQHPWCPPSTAAPSGSGTFSEGPPLTRVGSHHLSVFPVLAHSLTLIYCSHLSPPFVCSQTLTAISLCGQPLGVGDSVHLGHRCSSRTCSLCPLPSWLTSSTGQGALM